MTAPPTVDDLEQLVADLTTRFDNGPPLLTRLRALAFPGRQPPADGTHPAGRPGSRPPVAPAYWLVADLEADARDLEQQARAALNLPPRPRPPNARHADRALRNLPDLLAALPPTHPAVADATRNLNRWHRLACEITGHAERWAPVRTFYDPDADETVPAACPYCHNASLRRRPADAAVVCCTPRCAAENGRRPEWHVDELTRLGLILRS